MTSVAAPQREAQLVRSAADIADGKVRCRLCGRRVRVDNGYWQRRLPDDVSGEQYHATRWFRWPEGAEPVLAHMCSRCWDDESRIDAEEDRWVTLIQYPALVWEAQEMAAQAKAQRGLERVNAAATAQGKPGIYTNLPQIVMRLGEDDAGEYGAARCPHCGAEGRYTVWFLCDDGLRHGAMRGCLQHFPRHRFFDLAQRIADKEREIADANRNGGSRQLASWDAEVRGAIEAFSQGAISEDEAQARIDTAEGRKRAWMKRRGYRR